MSEGDEVEITDTSLPNLIKIRNGSTGDEDYIPALNCVFPSPDSNAKTAIERLQVQLLVCWTDCELNLKPKLYHVMTSLASQLQTQWITYSERHGSGGSRGGGRYGGYRSTYRSGGGGGGNDGGSNEEEGGWEAKVLRRIKRIVDATKDETSAIDLTRLRKTFCSVENELLRQTSNYLTPMIETVVSLDKAVLCYQVFRKNWRQFQQTLREGIPPIESVIQINTQDPNIFRDHSKHIKYYQVVLVAEDTVTTEETVETTPEETTTNSQDEMTTSWGVIETEPVKTEPGETPEEEKTTTSEDEITTSWGVIENEPVKPENTETETFSTETETFSTETETFTTETETEVFSTETETTSVEEHSSTSHVESRRFVIRGVIDPRDGQEISMREAVAARIIDQNAGLYRNVRTGATMSIQAAMNEGLIIMECVSESSQALPSKLVVTETKERTETVAPPVAAVAPPPQVKKEKIDSIGLITIHSQVDSCECTLTGVLDAKSGERLEMEEARSRGILNDADGYYVNSQTGQHVLMNDAIKAGWVLTEFDSGTSEPWEQRESITYVISAVTDQKSYKPVPFGEAVRCGLIDRATGCYVDSRTGVRVQAAEAIRRGLFKAVVVDDASALNVAATDPDVVNQVNKAKRDAMRGVKVIGTIKHAPRGSKDYRRLF